MFKYNIQSYDSQVNLIELCDAIIIATPTITHHEIAKDALKSGCHIFIEKPITTTIDEANELIQISNQNNVFIQVGHIERFNRAFIESLNYIVNPQFIEIHRIYYTTRSDT